MKIPEIGRLQPDPQHLEITLYLDPGLLWFKGHFAVQPLLPGVAQLDWVMHYASALAPGYRFHSIQNVKFAAPLLPENTVTLALAWQPERLAISAMRVTRATPPAAGRFAYVSNLPSLRADPVLQPRGDDGFGAGAPRAFRSALSDGGRWQR